MTIAGKLESEVRKLGEKISKLVEQVAEGEKKKKRINLIRDRKYLANWTSMSVNVCLFKRHLTNVDISNTLTAC